MMEAPGKRHTRTDRQTQNARRLRIAGMTEGVMTLQVGEVLDLSLKTALVEHQRMLQPQSLCLLQLGTNGDVSTIRCRVVNSRVSPGRTDDGLYYQTGVEFLDLSPAAEQTLKSVVQSLRAHGDYETGAP